MRPKSPIVSQAGSALATISYLREVAALTETEAADSSYVVVEPEALAAASGDLTGIEEAIKGAAAAAAPSTTGIPAAAGDEVSAAIARFSAARPRVSGAQRAGDAISGPVRTHVERGRGRVRDR